jgi:YidC/Oxa1 family membrane protein insertase
MNNDNRNLIIALVLMTAVWFGFSLLYPAQPPQPQSEAPVAQNSAPTPPPASITAPVEDVAPEFSTPSAVPVRPREIVVETDKYRAVVSTAGARLVSMELKGYRANNTPGSGPVELVKATDPRYATLRTTGSEALALAANAVYILDNEQELFTVAGGSREQLTFRHVTPSGVEVAKRFTFQGDLYTIDLAVGVRNRSTVPLSGTVDLALVEQWNADARDSYSFAGPATLVGDKLDQLDVEDLSKDAKSYGKETVWSSLQSKYFMMAAVPLAGAVDKVRVALSGDLLESVITSPYLALQPAEYRQFDLLLFFGPKDHELLEAAAHQLERAVYFGWFDLLAKPLLYVLVFFNGFLNNYGMAIILLTIIIKLIFWPLTHKSFSSMKSMQKLQPEMQKLREKFKNDKERLNRELMELYKTHRVNPLGGCLPMLVQIPVFFALYKVLLDSIALRQAPFMLWLTDLSAKDPYYITPLLMGASMFVQQKMTPATADPMQAKIFMFMPVVFTFLFLNFPSGLVIYWLVNNLLTIAQQYYINRRLT